MLIYMLKGDFEGLKNRKKRSKNPSLLKMLTYLYLFL